jgi:hypothetical protein
MNTMPNGSASPYALGRPSTPVSSPLLPPPPREQLVITNTANTNPKENNFFICNEVYPNITSPYTYF